MLIAGFVISGDGTLRLLVRGLGPELAARGVRGALTDPRITLYRQGTAVATNDNWTEQAEVPVMITLAQRIGAAALPSGSRDAALLVELSAGIYTVHGSATDGSSGEMLIELFVDE